MSCGCGRSPTGKCIGWHKLSEEQYQIKKAEYEEKEKNKMSIAEQYPDGYSIEWRKLDDQVYINKEKKMKPGEAIILAAKAQAEGEIAVHKANIMVYQTMPAGIGEHSDVTEAVIEELDKMAAAADRLEMIEKYFSS